MTILDKAAAVYEAFRAAVEPEESQAVLSILATMIQHEWQVEQARQQAEQMQAMQRAQQIAAPPGRLFQ